MPELALSIEHLFKQYRLGEIGTGTISHDLNRWWARLRGKEDPYSQVGQVNDRAKKGSSSDYVWALRDLNFEVRQGEVLGIIGKNGAGKSTLLKLISRVTSPTKGSIRARGRIASLLEVGTGMHPEMTARENIYLNGAILGMRRYEIARKFDDIVDFAGCALYVDTPVKRYSSGMRVRLGFAVAAFLEPEILIVDEVLAVGDAEFQKKAIGKMKEVSQGSGRTVLFVSHNMGSIRTLCNRAIVLHQGQQIYDSTPEDSIQFYLNYEANAHEKDLANRTDRTGDGRLKFVRVELQRPDGTPAGEVLSGDPARLVFHYRTTAPIDPQRMVLGITISDKDEAPLIGFVSDEMGTVFEPFQSEGTFTLDIPKLLLRGGHYTIKLFASEGGTRSEHILDHISHAFELTVQSGDFWSVGHSNRNSSMLLVDGTIQHRQ